MLLLLPYEIETLQQERPWANWAIIATSSIVSILALFGGLPFDVVDAFVLDGFAPSGLLGHVLLHADLLHLIGNMVFLWVFGNAVCSNVGNLVYLALFAAGTLVSASIHLLIDGSPAIGASGAINAIVGVVLAMYPLNRIHLFWVFLIRGGTFSCTAWMVILAWLAFDLWGVVTGGAFVAYWAHIGGLVGGTAFGLLALQLGWIRMTDCDNRCLLEILRNEEWDA